jgi:glycosyltransferase involved in cell wall biosynthesis
MLDPSKAHLEDSATQIELSVVVPVFNEEECLDATIPEICDVLNTLSYRWELLAINDGSSDCSLEKLNKLQKIYRQITVISLRSNFGQTAAMSAGIQHAIGRLIVTIDADGQNDPAEIPRLLKMLGDDVDVVVGWRETRKDSFTRRLPSRVANVVISKASGIRLHDYGCTLKVFRSEVIKEVQLIGEMHRMIPIFVSRFGAKILEVPVNHRPRLAGQSKYGLGRTPRVVADLLVARFILASLSKPMHFFGKFAVAGLVCSSVTAALAFWLKMSGDRDFVETPLPLVAVFAAMFASLAFLSGILAELLVRIYFNQVGPPYKIQRITAG